VTEAPKPFSILISDLSGLLEEQREGTARARERGSNPPIRSRGKSVVARAARAARAGRACAVAHDTSHRVRWLVAAHFFTTNCRRFMELHRRFFHGHTRHLPELPFAFADFAQWQRSWLQRGSLEISYWKQKLDGATTALDLPTSHSRPPVQTFRGAAKYFSLGAEFSAKLNQLSRRENVTLFMLLLAAFQTLLHRYSAQETILVGSPVAGRTRSEAENLIGLFLNTLVCAVIFPAIRRFANCFSA